MKESERNERKKLNSQAFGTHKYRFLHNKRRKNAQFAKKIKAFVTNDQSFSSYYTNLPEI